MDYLLLFGSLSVGAMLVTYWLEPRSRWFVLGFALACGASSAYGWLAGTYPFGVIEAIWALVAFRRFLSRQAGLSAGHAIDMSDSVSISKAGA